MKSPIRQPKRIAPYSVPKRFGIGSILMITVLFALVFAVMRAMNVSLPGVLGTTAFLMAVGAAQSVFERSPRVASVVTGSLLFLMFSIISSALDFGRLDNDFNRKGLVVLLGVIPASIFTGGLMGYLAGLLLAAVFMFIDMFLKAVKRQRLDEPSTVDDERTSNLRAILRRGLDEPIVVKDKTVAADAEFTPGDRPQTP